ncbi:protein FAR1-RELATED SEQUENCE 6-like [Chenopodium quinoa]|uniref:protein FAR1-RELATED SEQUENCE 6-like n=1 Tax=Chenopodium quinoa TaxID=63459 RepID=UPI000B770646|nr:protein FAR1-RELATED SEQUENCE 6-like [Chenopodium quinoa]
MEWNYNSLRDAFNERDTRCILAIPLSSSRLPRDELAWAFSKNGLYSGKMDAIDGELIDSIAFMQNDFCSSPNTSPLVLIVENKCITPLSGTSLVPDSVETCTALMSPPIGIVHTIDTIHSSNRGVFVLKPPKVGMIFKNWEDIEMYYKEYAEQVGFGVTRCQWSSSKKDKNVKLCFTWRCECWGPPNLRARREANKQAKAMGEGETGGVVNGVIGEDELARGKRKSKKCFYLAMLYSGVTAEAKEYRMKKYTATVKRRLVNYFGEGVPIKKIHGCLDVDKGGVENMPSVKDLKHEVYKERRLKMQGGDDAAMMRYFEYMQRDNKNFYHAIRLDEEGQLKDVMWVDAHSHVAYEEFGDVWLLAMNNKPPRAILTDQAPATRRALSEVMPDSRHRWCIWHIMKKLSEKLGKLELYNDFKNPLKVVIYKSFMAEEFESSWCFLMKEYDLEGNDWLEGLYDERHMWVPAFMKEYFLALTVFVMDLLQGKPNYLNFHNSIAKLWRSVLKIKQLQMTRG